MFTWTDSLVFLQKIWIYPGSAKNYSSRSSATMLSHRQVSTQQRKGEHFYGEEKVGGTVTINKEFKVFHWLKASRKGEGISFSCWTPLSIVGYDISSSGFWILFNWGFNLFYFYKRVSWSILICPVFMCDSLENVIPGRREPVAITAG